MPEVHESDWILICGHIGDLPINLYTEEPHTVEYLRSMGVRVPEGTADMTPVHWMALCRECAIMTAGTTLKLENAIDPQVRQLKELRDDARYFRGEVN